MESVSTGPPPALFTLRSPIPSRSPSARAQARTVLPPSAHQQPHTRSRPHAHTRSRPHAHTRSRPHACAHAHEHTPTHTSTHPRTRAHTHAPTHTPTHAPASHASPAYTFASRARTPAHARAPALHTHSSNSEDSGIGRRVALRPMSSTESWEVLPVWSGQGVWRSGEIWAGDARGNVGCSLENFAKQIILRIFVWEKTQNQYNYEK